MPKTVTWMAEVFRNGKNGPICVIKSLIAGDPEWAIDSFAEDEKLGDLINHSIDGTYQFENGSIIVKRYSK